MCCPFNSPLNSFLFKIVMMKKILFAALAFAVVLPAAAQDTYESARLLGGDLNGTARYVGMGGAMEALGADISTTGTNPAGIGLFRHDFVSAGFGLVSQADANEFDGRSTTNMSFDQVGFVYTMRQDRSSYINLAFNYHKSRNFNQILSVTDRLDGASQSKLTLDKFAEGVIKSSDDLTYNQVDVLYHEGLYDTNLILKDGSFNKDAYRFDGDNYTFNRGNKGYISEFDLNISGNINDRVYLGVTVGIHDVHYRGYSNYFENVKSNTLDLRTAELEDSRDLDGSGYEVKLGAVIRPIESSPFRFGLYINSPIFYDLRSVNKTGLRLNGQYFADENPRHDELKYEFRTPWKFGVSLGHTIGTNLALGATYEFSDYGATDARIKRGEGYDWYYDTYYTKTDRDKEMNDHIKQTLKGVHTVKVGAEFKPMPIMSLRLGYNFVSPMYKQDAYRGVDVWSLGNYYSSETNYVNWKATHRITAGVGFTFDHFKVDMAYQYQTKKGQFLPFAGSGNDNLPFDQEVKNNRQQVLLTLGYSF